MEPADIPPGVSVRFPEVHGLAWKLPTFRESLKMFRLRAGIQILCVHFNRSFLGRCRRACRDTIRAIGHDLKADFSLLQIEIGRFILIADLTRPVHFHKHARAIQFLDGRHAAARMSTLRCRDFFAADAAESDVLRLLRFDAKLIELGVHFRFHGFDIERARKGRCFTGVIRMLEHMHIGPGHQFSLVNQPRFFDDIAWIGRFLGCPADF